MAAGDYIFVCRSAKKNSTAIAGVTHARIVARTVTMQNQGAAGSPGPVETRINRKSVRVEIYGLQFATLLALLGTTAENIVLGTVGAAGANEKITIKTVDLVEPLGAVEIPDPDSGGKLARYGIAGEAQWGLSDTFATMVLAASDA